MPEINDVVRHVILRVLVDQEGLARNLSDAKGKLKGLQDAEKAANKERIKDADRVTEAIHKQSDALGKNQQAHEAAERSRAGAARSTVERHRQATTAIQDETAAVKGQITEEARAEAIREKTRQDRLKKDAARKRFNQDTNQQSVKFDAEQAARETRMFNDEKQHLLNLQAARRAGTKQAQADLDVTLEKAKKVQAEIGKIEEGARNTRLGGQVNRATKVNESQGRVDRLDENAVASRERALNESNARINQRGMDGDQKRAASQKKLDEEADRRRQTAADRVLADLAKIRDEVSTSSSRAQTARSQSQTAGSRAVDAGNATRFNETDRVVKAREREAVVAARVEEIQARTAKTDEARAKLAKEIERAESRAANTARRSLASGVAGNLKEAGRAISDTLRASSSANPDTRMTRTRRALGALDQEFRSGNGALSAVTAFFGNFKKGEGEAVSVLDRIRARIRGVKEESKAATDGGGGGNFGGRIIQSLNGMAESFTSKGGPILKFLFSFRGLIVAVLVALGPLAAMLGALGAAALGLAGDLANLSGVLFALPGIIGALLAGFGALAIALGPLKNIISSYTSAQKQATSATRDARQAALDLKIAIISEQQAHLAYNRALQDQPRSLLKLSQARKQAARDIQDYRLALQKLKFDEEGAQLGVDSAEQNLRRSLADASANNLDRRIAYHDVQGALYDKRDQKVAGQRLLEDSSLAFKKGVDGSDQVIDALRAVQDATLNVASSFQAWQKSIIEVDKASLVSKAGGQAAAQLAAQIAKLPPQTRKVAVAILDLLKGPYKDLKDRLSEQIFGPISQETGKFATLIQELGTFLTPAATAIGKFAHQALGLFTNPEWKKFFSAQGDANNRILGGLGDAALSVAGGLRAIIEVARPFTDFVVGGIAGMAKTFDRLANSDKGRAGLAKFLNGTMQTMRELKPVVVDLAVGLFSFLTALNDPSGANNNQSFITRINLGMQGLAHYFRELGEKAKDPNGGFQTWLRRVGPLIKDVVHFIGQAASFFGKLFSDPSNIDEAEKLLGRIGGKWLPVLAELFDKLSTSKALSNLAAAIGSALGALDEFFDHGGTKAIQYFFEIIQFLGTRTEWLATKVPLLTTVLGGLATALGVIAGVALFGRLTGLFKLIGLIVGGYNLLKKGGILGVVDVIKDKFLQRDAGDSAARRAGVAKGETGTRAQTGGVLPTLYRMEKHLETIIALLRRPGSGGAGSGGHGGGGPDGGGPTPNSTEDINRRRDETRRARNKRLRRGGKSAFGDYERDAATIIADDVDKQARQRAQQVADDRARSRIVPGSVNDPSPIPYGGDAYSVTEGRPTTLRNPQTPEEVRQYRNSPQGQIERRQQVEQARAARTGVPYRDRPLNRNDFDFSSIAGDEQAAYAADPVVTRAQQRRYRRGQQRLATKPPSLPVLADVGRDDSRYISLAQQQQGSRRFTIPAGGPSLGTLSDLANLPQLPSQESPRRRRFSTFADRVGGPVPRSRAARIGSFFSRLLPGGGSRGSRSDPGLIDDVLGVGADTGPEEQAARPSRFSRMRAGFNEAMLGYNATEDDFPSLVADRTRREENRRLSDRLGSEFSTTLQGPGEDRRSRPGRRFLDRLFPSDDEGSIGIERPTSGRFLGIPLPGQEAAGERAASRAERAARRGAGRGGRRLLGRLGGGLARGAGGLVKGFAGGLVGAALAGVGGIAGEYVTDKFVKNDEDKASINRATGAISTGAGIGATIGSIVPGVGTVIGGAIGGLAGGAYSLVKDKNLRNFVGGKIASGAKAVGGFLGGAVSGVKDFFTPDKDTGTAGKIASVVGGPLGALLSKTDIGKSILGSLTKAASGIGDFFTKTIPGFFSKGVQGISNFFTKTLPALPGKAFDAITTGFGVLLGFFLYDVPRAAAKAWHGITGFFTTTLPHAAQAAFNGIRRFINAIPGFFTQTIPRWFRTVNHWVDVHVRKPLRTFVTQTVPQFFTQTIPRWFRAAPHWLDVHVRKPITDFFTIKVPQFFTVTLPNVIKGLPGFLYNNLVQPILDFFSGIAGHIGDFLKGGWSWAKGLFARGASNVAKGAESRKMSGGLIEGIFQGAEDTVALRATPEEFVVRRSKVVQPFGKQFLNDYNEGRFNPADWYAGLTASTAPQFMSVVPSNAPALSAQTGSVVNHTTDAGLHMGDITINNPVQEKSEHSLRRQIQIAAIRHRR